MAPERRLHISDVHKSYGRRSVLRGVDFTVSAGSLTGVVGENGSGKSTLLKIAVGQLTPSRGTVRRFSALGYCPQQAVVNDTLTVAQHLRLFQVAYRLPDLERAWELVDLLGFADERRTQVGRLSGGTRQKLNLTLALMHDPPLLVLDEPYQGFDWDTHQRFWHLADRLRSQGRSVVVVSHLLHDLQHFDMVHQLRDGRLHPQGAA
ncbi:putative ABC transport system ATP-binding protein [Streptomyces ambofaciens ATCC 23877]|uniref:Putative ABC transport system ATP-binding protein n=1 Tax=Streptomyces ambofaciens (strain ATCC 23877 / 3486 / DSM 40053 / JCM 4204 / NBRC 12836 / NRRL B-2516) TaxID=278992 RepID=A0AC87_STRA7|nr:ABC transporter ATP-binding protein [Streptomyces ambofaciens]AKZ60261.1 putative ABC transport system ATP-binding protein [Streptomyces ambofaciens ATCC 23877]CAJ88091.1 putative ABC transport system ATP-binding protein [Streptomyces ambofaciens ATCC 23877]